MMFIALIRCLEDHYLNTITRLGEIGTLLVPVFDYARSAGLSSGR